jgi:membrane-associated phospholipid phosphatase
MPVLRKANYMLVFGACNLFVYFLIQGYVSNEYNFLTPFDTAFPFMPEFVWIYQSLLPVIALTMVLLVKSKRLFFNTFWSCLVATVVIHLFWLVFPSFYPRPEIDPVTLSEAFVQLSYEIDNSSNTFPSGHVAFSWIMYLGARKSELAKKTSGLSNLYLLWALGVSLSTLAIKMHYVIDVIGGLAIASFCFYLVGWAIRRFNWYPPEDTSYRHEGIQNN